jgi:hypothetical protein
LAECQAEIEERLRAPAVAGDATGQTALDSRDGFQWLSLLAVLSGALSSLESAIAGDAT